MSHSYFSNQKLLDTLIFNVRFMASVLNDSFNKFTWTLIKQTIGVLHHQPPCPWQPGYITIVLLSALSAGGTAATDCDCDACAHVAPRSSRCRIHHNTPPQVALHKTQFSLGQISCVSVHLTVPGLPRRRPPKSACRRRRRNGGCYAIMWWISTTPHRAPRRS